MKHLFMIFLFVTASAAEATTVTDSRGNHVLSERPQRIVALSWSLTEQLLTLGVQPVAIADPAGYREWVVRPMLPEAVAGVGLRQEPNLERIAELNPDLILASDDQISFVPQLERIAPVLHFDTFSADHENAEAARRTLRTLAGLVGDEEMAAERLATLDAHLAVLRQRLHAHFDGAPPAVGVVRFVDEARVVIHGENSMPDAALKALGLQNAIHLAPSKWGIAFRKVEELGRIKEDAVLMYIQPFPAGKKLFEKPLWQAMPFVRDGRFHALPPVWTYGGAASVGFLAEEIAGVLLAIEAE